MAGIPTLDPKVAGSIPLTQGFVIMILVRSIHKCQQMDYQFALNAPLGEIMPNL